MVNEWDDHEWLEFIVVYDRVGDKIGLVWFEKIEWGVAYLGRRYKSTEESRLGVITDTYFFAENLKFVPQDGRGVTGLILIN
jgi:hypothetical protein